MDRKKDNKAQDLPWPDGTPKYDFLDEPYNEVLKKCHIPEKMRIDFLDGKLFYNVREFVDDHSKICEGCNNIAVEEHLKRGCQQCQSLLDKLDAFS